MKEVFKRLVTTALIAGLAYLGITHFEVTISTLAIIFAIMIFARTNNYEGAKLAKLAGQPLIDQLIEIDKEMGKHTSIRYARILRLSKSMCLFKLDRADEALQVLRSIKSPGSGDVVVQYYTQLVLTLNVLGEHEEIKDIYREKHNILDRDNIGPSLYSITKLSEAIYEYIRGNTGTSEDKLYDLLRLSLHGPLTYYYLGKIMVDRNDIERARNYLDTAKTLAIHCEHLLCRRLCEDMIEKLG